MTEQRLKVESGPPEHMLSDSDSAGPPPTEDRSAAAQAKDKAQEVAGKAEPAKEKARDLAGQAKVHAQAAADQAKGKAAAQVDARTTQIGERFGAQAQSLDGVAEELRRQGKDAPAKVAEQAAQRVKDVGSYLERADGESLVGAAKDAATENPAAAAVVGAAAGFVAGRVIKASQADGSSEEDDQPGGPGGGGT